MNNNLISASTDKYKFIKLNKDNLHKLGLTSEIRILPDHDYTGLIMLNDLNKVIGYGFIDDGYINNVYINPGYRNKGFGTLLVNEIMTRFKGNRLCVGKNKQDLINFYKTLGFKPYAEDTLFYYMNTTKDDSYVDYPIKMETEKEEELEENKQLTEANRRCSICGAQTYNVTGICDNCWEHADEIDDDEKYESLQDMHPKKFYHLSEKELNKPLTPRIPKSDFEEQKTPRICVSSSIQGCLIGINENKDIKGKTFKVYSITTSNYKKPSINEVADRDITDEYWILEEVKPKYEYDIKVIEKEGSKKEKINGETFNVPIWKYEKYESLSETLLEDKRTALISKSQNVGGYKNTKYGKNRFERKKYSKLAQTVQQYNKIDMNEFFKQDTLIVTIPVMGETDNYTVTIKMEGVCSELAKSIKSNNNKLEFKNVIQALTKTFNTADIYTKCTCDDFKYRFAHWNIVNNVSVDDTAHDPGPGKGIANPNDDKGRGCKHILLTLSNGDWLMKVASVINNYIHYAEEHMQKAFMKAIFPRLYGMPAEDAKEQNIIPEDINLETETNIIEVINDWAKNRGKFVKGSNVNPVQADKLSKEQQAKKDAEEKTEEKENAEKS